MCFTAWILTAQKWGFLLRISLANLSKSAENCGFDYIYWRKFHFFAVSSKNYEYHLKMHDFILTSSWITTFLIKCTWWMWNQFREKHFIIRYIIWYNYIFMAFKIYKIFKIYMAWPIYFKSRLRFNILNPSLSTFLGNLLHTFSFLTGVLQMFSFLFINLPFSCKIATFWKCKYFLTHFFCSCFYAHFATHCLTWDCIFEQASDAFLTNM